MRSNLGLCGNAFTMGRIFIEKDIDGSQQNNQPAPEGQPAASGEKPETLMRPEEKDLKKLQLDKLKNAIAIPIFDKQTAAPVAVVQAYNFDELNYLKRIEDDILMSLSQIFSATI